MRALFSLQQDHQLLLALTEALDGFSQAMQRAEDINADEVGAFAHAFRGFADYLHYEKEEQVLLPFLVRHGFDWDGELLERVRADHRQDRYLIDVLHHAAERDGSYSNEDRRRLQGTAATLANEQRRLSMQQEIELFPEIASGLDAEALAGLQAELSDFDQHHLSSATALRQLIRRLVDRYGVEGHRLGDVKARYDA